MSHDEENWASWKCGGGPHNSSEQSNVVDHALNKQNKLAGIIVTYAGTESELDRPVTRSVPDKFMSSLPA